MHGETVKKKLLGFYQFFDSLNSLLFVNWNIVCIAVSCFLAPCIGITYLVIINCTSL